MLHYKVLQNVKGVTNILKDRIQEKFKEVIFNFTLKAKHFLFELFYSFYNYTTLKTL